MLRLWDSFEQGLLATTVGAVPNRLVEKLETRLTIEPPSGVPNQADSPLRPHTATVPDFGPFCLAGETAPSNSPEQEFL